MSINTNFAPASSSGSFFHAAIVRGLADRRQGDLAAVPRASE
jgi:hypothetical protein